LHALLAGQIMGREVCVIADIEEALFAQWSHFGRWPGATLHDEHGLLWFETPISHLPYNGVIRTRLETGADVPQLVARVVDGFRSRGVQSFWVIHPTSAPADLPDVLARHDVRSVERMTGMSIEIADSQAEPAPSDVEFREVISDDELRAYTDLTMSYWEIAADEQPLVVRFHRHWGPGRAPGHRYVGWRGEVPVSKAYLSTAGPAGVASIYGMSVLPEARGRGVAAGMTTTLLRHAKALGMARVVLHSTQMARGVYARAGFVAHCELEVLATAPLWSDEH
jgi:GNAT superfamily N-acetyltransferase